MSLHTQNRCWVFVMPPSYAVSWQPVCRLRRGKKLSRKCPLSQSDFSEPTASVQRLGIARRTRFEVAPMSAFVYRRADRKMSFLCRTCSTHPFQHRVSTCEMSPLARPRAALTGEMQPRWPRQPFRGPRFPHNLEKGVPSFSRYPRNLTIPGSIPVRVQRMAASLNLACCIAPATWWRRFVLPLAS